MDRHRQHPELVVVSLTYHLLSNFASHRRHLFLESSAFYPALCKPSYDYPILNLSKS